MRGPTSHTAIGLILLGVPVALGASSAATAPQGPALERVQHSLGLARDVVMGEGSHDEKLAKLKDVARALLDTDTMGRRAMGSRLADVAPEKQSEYLELFSDLIVRAYLQKLLFFKKPEFRYLRVEGAGEEAMVYTLIVTRKDEFTVEYEMRESDGKWFATDILVEQASLTKNYRSQFRRILQKQSFDELLDRMRGKLRTLKADS